MQGNKQCETLGTVTRSVGNLGLSWLWIEKRTLIGLRRDKAIYLLKELKNPEEIWLQTWFRSSGEIIRTIFPGIEVDLSLYLLHFLVQSCDHYNLKVTLPSPYLVWKHFPLRMDNQFITKDYLRRTRQNCHPFTAPEKQGMTGVPKAHEVTEPFFVQHKRSHYWIQFKDDGHTDWRFV